MFIATRNPVRVATGIPIVVALVQVACASGGAARGRGSEGGAGEDGSPEAAGAPGPAGSAGNQGVAGAGGKGAAGSAGAPGAAGAAGDQSGDFCYVDFPCDEGSWCDLATDQRMVGVTYDCSAVCGDVPCSGMGCDVSPLDCEPGTVCVNVGTGPSLGAECLPVANACGGPEKRACSPAETCEYGDFVPDDTGWSGGGPPSETEANGGYGRCVPAPDAGPDAAGEGGADAGTPPPPDAATAD